MVYTIAHFNETHAQTNYGAKIKATGTPCGGSPAMWTAGLQWTIGTVGCQEYLYNVLAPYYGGKSGVTNNFRCDAWGILSTDYYISSTNFL